MSAFEQFADTAVDPPVRGFLHESSAANSAVVLAHGASSNANSAVLVAIGEAFADAGFVRGPRRLKTVLMPTSFRTPIAYFMDAWKTGANMKPKPISSMQRPT